MLFLKNPPDNRFLRPHRQIWQESEPHNNESEENTVEELSRELADGQRTINFVTETKKECDTAKQKGEAIVEQQICSFKRMEKNNEMSKSQKEDLTRHEDFVRQGGEYNYESFKTPEDVYNNLKEISSLPEGFCKAISQSLFDYSKGATLLGRLEELNAIGVDYYGSASDNPGASPDMSRQEIHDMKVILKKYGLIL